MGQARSPIAWLLLALLRAWSRSRRLGRLGRGCLGILRLFLQLRHLGLGRRKPALGRVELVLLCGEVLLGCLSRRLGGLQILFALLVLAGGANEERSTKHERHDGLQCSSHSVVPTFLLERSGSQSCALRRDSAQFYVLPGSLSNDSRLANSWQNALLPPYA